MTTTEIPIRRIALAGNAATLVWGLLLFPVLGLLSLLCTLALRETATAGSLADREPVAR